MEHLRLRHNTYFARFHVPADVRDAFDGKSEIIVSLKTDNKGIALERKAHIISRLKSKVQEARGRVGSIEADALWWKKQLEEAKSDRSEKLDELVEYVVKRFKVPQHYQSFPDTADGLRALGGPKVAHFLDIVHGDETPLKPFIDPWSKAFARTVQQKTADMARSVVARFVARFPSAQLVTRRAVAEWIAERIDKGNSPNTIQRDLTHIRAFWKYLRDHEGAVTNDEPLRDHKIGRAKDQHKNGWQAFSPEDVVRLYNKAIELEDEPLANLILLGAFTGARIEEICQLKTMDCTSGVFRITDSKTKAGIREVPIHRKLKPLVKRLIKNSKDGFLLSGLPTGNQYGDRSNPIGKRFGRLKSGELGFSREFVFHSIRKTVTTMLEQAGVTENVTADIVGHDKPRITYGLYSGGSSLEQKKAALRKLKYPGL